MDIKINILKYSLRNLSTKVMPTNFVHVHPLLIAM